MIDKVVCFVVFKTIIITFLVINITLSNLGLKIVLNHQLWIFEDFY